MNSSRAQAPPVNLKERIAALQQRNVSPSYSQLPQSTSAPLTSTGNGLKDKIAKFEQKGGVPVPRGSFGLGAPPVAENGQAKRRGELYGNRIPSVPGRNSRSVSPLPPSYQGIRSRKVSTSGSDLDAADFSSPDLPSDYPSPSQTPSLISPNYTGDYPINHAVPASAFATALEAARRSASASDVFGRYNREASQSPRSPAFSMNSFSQNSPASPSDEPDDGVETDPITPAIIVSPDLALSPPIEIAETNSNDQVVEPLEVELSSTSPCPSALPQVTISTTLVDEMVTVQDPFVQVPEIIVSDIVTLPYLTDTETSQSPPLNITIQNSKQSIGIPQITSSEEPPSLKESIPSSISTPGLLSNNLQDTASESELSPGSPCHPPPLMLDEPTPSFNKGSISIDEYNKADKLRPVDNIIDQLGELSVDDGGAAVDFNQLMEVEASDPELEEQESHGAVISEGFAVDGVDSTGGSLTPKTSEVEIGPIDDQTKGREILSTDSFSLTIDLPSQRPDLLSAKIPDSPIDPSTPKPSPQNEIIQTANQEELVVAEEKSSTDAPNPAAAVDQSQLPDVSLTNLSGEAQDIEYSSEFSSLVTPSQSEFSPPFTPSSTSSRPRSVIETSPGKVAVAERFSPIVSRGVPFYLSARNQVEEPHNDLSEFGAVSLHKQSHSYSHSQTYISHSSETEGDTKVVNSDSKPASFSAVVHRKVTEMSPGSSLPSIVRKVPTTPQVARVKKSVQETPSSPASGDLAMLLEEAAMLEMRLLEGDLPSEESKISIPRPSTPPPQSHLLVPPAAPPGQEANKGISYIPRKRSFKVPLIRSKSTYHRDSPSISSDVVPSSEKEQLRDKASTLPIQSTAPLIPPLPNTGTISVPSVSQLEADDVPPTPPPKSPPPSYIPNIRRFASTSGSSRTMPGAYPRYSMSTSSEISSEDSGPVITTPNDNLEVATAYNSGHHSRTTSGIHWPSVSPKKTSSIKSGRSLGRATSFAERIWNRARTKSSVSTLESDGSGDLLPELTETADTKPPVILPATPSSPLEPQNYIPPPRSSSLFPGMTSAGRPTSWLSVTSTSSSILPSPLFDQELFDSFPAVPQEMPATAPTLGSSYPLSNQSPSVVTLNTPETPASTFESQYLHLKQPGSDFLPLGRSSTMPLRPRKNADKYLPTLPS